MVFKYGSDERLDYLMQAAWDQIEFSDTNRVTVVPSLNVLHCHHLFEGECVVIVVIISLTLPPLGLIHRPMYISLSRDRL